MDLSCQAVLEVVAHGGRLVDELHHGHGVRVGCAHDGCEAHSLSDYSFVPSKPVWQWRIRPLVQGQPVVVQHEPAWKLLGQCVSGVLLQQLKKERIKRHIYATS